MWRALTEICLGPSVKYDFHCSDFHEKYTLFIKFLWVSLVPLFFKLDENVEYVEYSFTSLKMYASYCTMKFKISR